MLKEVDISDKRWNRELSPTISSDAIIIGAGVLGLIIAKKLADLGQQVTLIDSSPTLAQGASIRNHGWLHRGTAHAISIKDKEEAKQVVQKLIYGYEYLRSYAWECVEEPFNPIYAVTHNEELAKQATETWEELGVIFQEVAWKNFLHLEPSISSDTPRYVFKTADLQINSRMLYQKLLTDIHNKGGTVLNGATYKYSDNNSFEVNSRGRTYSLESNLFLYCVGANTAEEFAKLTGQNLNISFWKSHLLILPRVSRFSLISLDRDCPIIINHQNTSIVNRAYDETSSSHYEVEIDQSQVDLVFESLIRYFPQVANQKDQIKAISCSKPSIKFSKADRHSVRSEVLEPIPGHFFILPGKMTEAPYVADEMIHQLYAKLNFSDITPRPVDLFTQAKKLENRKTAFFAPIR